MEQLEIKVSLGSECGDGASNRGAARRVVWVGMVLGSVAADVFVAAGQRAVQSFWLRLLLALACLRADLCRAKASHWSSSGTTGASRSPFVAWAASRCAGNPRAESLTFWRPRGRNGGPNAYEAVIVLLTASFGRGSVRPQQFIGLVVACGEFDSSGRRTGFE